MYLRKNRIMFILRLLLTVASTGAAVGGWVDPDTPERSTESLSSGAVLQLVFSDEFDVDGRSFADGDDPRWTAMHKNDYTNAALQFYSRDRASTSRGLLNISTVAEDTTFTVVDGAGPSRETKHFQSAMLQGWDKFCFVGGAIEISAKLPGKKETGGLWPALWLMGNLARATYVSSSQNMWPWSFNTCDREQQHGQEISACNAVNHYDLHPFQGRGSPEVDILEAMMGSGHIPRSGTSKPYYSASLQVSPAISEFHPQSGQTPTVPWYKHGLEYGDDTSQNVFFYGSDLGKGETAYCTDALSANRNLNTTKFDAFHKYRLEWESGPSGYLKWYFDDALMYSVNAETLSATGAIIPEEPMYIILNTAMSGTWGFPTPCPAGCSCECYDCRDAACRCGLGAGFCDMLPASFLIDYVRVFQDTQNPAHTVGCSPTSHPTAKFIEGHKDRYMSSGDDRPLQDIRHGGGHCAADMDCVPSYSQNHGRIAGVPPANTSLSIGGVCERGQCRCPPHLTGPNCLAYTAFDQSNFDTNDDTWVLDLKEVEVYFPTSMYAMALVFAATAGVAVYFKYASNSAARIAHSYTTIPDDNMD